MISDFFTDAKTNIINFNRFIVSIINVHNHLDLDLLTSFFLFKIFSMIDEKFKIKMLCRLFC